MFPLDVPFCDFAVPAGGVLPRGRNRIGRIREM
jgi:hypothetical protein